MTPSEPPPLPPGKTSPQPLQYASPVQPNASAAWRHGKLLLAGRVVELPDACIRCNAPAVKRFRKDVYWHEPWLYALVIPGILIYAILAMVLRKKATYSCGLCAEHVKRRGRGLLAMWILVAIGVAGVVGGIAGVNAAFGPGQQDLSLVAVLTGFLFLIIAAGVGLVNVPLLRPKKIDEQYARYTGCSDAFLRNFPDANPSRDSVQPNSSSR